MRASSVLDAGVHCWLSGMRGRPSNWHGPWGMEIAHIASGQGRARRVDDRRAVVVLCSLAHRCHVSDADRHPWMHINGEHWPCIDERHTLWLKAWMDPEWYDEQFLRSIWIGALPTPKRPPEIWQKEMYKNRGVLY